MHRLGLRLSSLLLVLAAAPKAECTDTSVPPNLVVDLRLYEARSMRPDFQTIDNLSFFIATDGSGVTEQQWLATILRKTPDSILATLAYQSLPVDVDSGRARFSLAKRSRRFDLELDLNDFLEKGTFGATAAIDFVRGDEVLRKSDDKIKLRVGQTYVWGSRGLEISASDYLSHFRDFGSTGERGKLYQSLRSYTFFLIVALTPRLAEAPPAEPVVVAPNNSVALDELESPLGVPIEGKIQMELTLDGGGTPVDARIVRSSVPELNSGVLSQAPEWSFPQAAGKKARITLELHATP